MCSHRILVVEDEPAIAGAVTARLRAEGFETDIARDGPEAVSRFAAFDPHLVVLDIMLPGFDGLEVCRRIQSGRPVPVPVLMLTARDDEVDQLVGLGVGADDYLTKPVSMRVLAARVRALLRRAELPPVESGHHGTDPGGLPPGGGAPNRLITLGRLQIDRASRQVRQDGVEVHLTPTEFELLTCLATEPGSVFTRLQLLDRIWDWADAKGTRTVDSHVKALRRKLGLGLIRTVHGVGYALDAPK